MMIDSRSMLRMLAPRIALTVLAVAAIVALAIVTIKHSRAEHAPAPVVSP